MKTVTAFAVSASGVQKSREDVGAAEPYLPVPLYLPAFPVFVPSVSVCGGAENRNRKSVLQD